MSNDIINQNADGQDPANTQDTATTNTPAGGSELSQNETSETAVAEQPASEKKEPFAPQPQTPHDDFDWSVDKRNVTSYSKEEKEKYDHVYENTFKQINDGEMINGIVVALTKTDVVVNIGFKSDGLVSLNEFRDMPNLKVGDEVEVLVAE